MENFNVKYRPARFADVIGQEGAVKLLKHVALCDELPIRSIVLKGSYGSGKTTLARIMAKAINCTNLKRNGDVCGECVGCKSALGDMSETYVEYDTAKVGNIDFIRGLKDRLSYSATDMKRLVVFDECHTASRQALNGMLKIIEEGVENTLFMFCTTEAVLPTIESRSIVVDITTLPYDRIAERVTSICGLEGIQITDNIAETIAVKSGGHMRNALSTLQHYALIGEEAVRNSYTTIEEYMRLCIGAKCDSDATILDRVCSYPLTDVSQSISRFCNHLYTDAKYKGVLSQKNWKGTRGLLSDVIVDYWYNPTIREMMRCEGGFHTALVRFSKLFNNE